MKKFIASYHLAIVPKPFNSLIQTKRLKDCSIIRSKKCKKTYTMRHLISPHTVLPKKLVRADAQFPCHIRK